MNLVIGCNKVILPMIKVHLHIDIENERIRTTCPIFYVFIQDLVDNVDSTVVLLLLIFLSFR